MIFVIQNIERRCWHVDHSTGRRGVAQFVHFFLSYASNLSYFPLHSVSALFTHCAKKKKEEKGGAVFITTALFSANLLLKQKKPKYVNHIQQSVRKR
ncbi:hypothetical protein H5410_008839 [Solanum commersonii]|uniref:Uncharacterized protein n=1 Tax=Solanum commersonii TaxID=4109 RepID=A0A9J6AG36_SOLCO|nr:hypothetical protein H5410_008839 [Solanum commersonii]